NASTAVCTTASAVSCVERSPGAIAHSPPAALTASRASSSRSLDRETATTRAPSAANRSSAARPMPLLAPVTMATLPSSRPLIRPALLPLDPRRGLCVTSHRRYWSDVFLSSTASGRSGRGIDADSSDEVRGVGVLSGAYNFRDLGGMRTRDGGVLRRGRLFRSDTLQELTDEDVARLVDELEIAFVVDLRQAVEAVEEGRGPLARRPVCYANVPLVDVDAPAGTPGELTVTQYLDHLEHDPNLVVAVELVASVVHRPTVLHCAAGKDRTGVVTALVLGLLGVEDEQIVADYMVTATNMDRITERFGRWP